MKSPSCTPPWQVLVVRPCSEKKAGQRLRELGFEACAPTQWQYRQWSGRRKKEEVVLFLNNVFIAAAPVRHNEAFRTGDEVEILGGYRGLATGQNGAQRLQVALPGLHCFAQVELRDTELRKIPV